MGKQYIARVDLHLRDAQGHREVKSGEVFDAEFLPEVHAKSHLESGHIEEYSDEPGQSTPASQSSDTEDGQQKSGSKPKTETKPKATAKLKADPKPKAGAKPKARPETKDPAPAPTEPPKSKIEKIEDIPGVDEAVLSALNGIYSTVKEISVAKPEELAEIAGISEDRAAKIVEAAKG
jgi:hypothetical protein